MQTVEKYDWKDNTYNIEELLKKFPVVKDHRQPQEIYEAISPKLVKRKRPFWLFPAAASFGVLVVIFIVSSSLYNHKPMNSSKKDSSKQETMDMGLNTLQANDVPNIFSETNQRYAVQPEENYLTFSLTDPNDKKIIIPISMITDEKELPSLHNYNNKISKMPFDQWGLLPIDLDNVKKLYTKDDKLIIDIKSHTTSLDDNTFFESIKETFRWQNYHEIELLSDGKSQAIFPVEEAGNHAFIEYMYDEDHPTFLTPTKERYDTLSEAVKYMESENFKWHKPLHPPIPDGVDIEKIEGDKNKEHVKITFTNDSGLQNNEATTLMLDSLLLTAREFGYKTVTFSGAEDSSIEQIGPIPFHTAITVPVAPNPVVLE